MSLQSTGAGSPRLLPESMEVQIKSSVSRSAGFLLCGAAGLIWLAQLTWSVGDLAANAQTGPYRNLLGLPGAVVSDILLHAFGLAAVLALVPLFFWGMTLISGAPIAHIRRKIVLWAVSTLSLSGALAAVPTIQSWPLRQGFGGVVGDLIYATAAGLLSVAHLPESAVLSGLGMLAAGLAAYFGALGAGRREIRMVLRAPRPRREPVLTVPGGFTAGGFGIEPSLPMTPAPAAPGWSTQARAAMPAWMAPHARRPAEQAVPVAPAAMDDHGLPPLEEFDPHEAASSRMMAERFAPPGAQTGSVPRRAPAAPVAVQSMQPAAQSLQPAQAAPAEPRPARGGVKGMLSGLRGQKAGPAYRLPPLTFLKKATAQRPGPDLAQNVQRGVAKLLEDVLLDFGVKGKVQAIKPGPVVTLYETEPARGVKASRVIGLADDVARSMSATSARVALIPGRNVIGIELPNASRETVYLRELLEHESFKSATGALPLVLGRSISGDPVVADLARMPHLLVAGTTGSGKSVGINSMILSLIYRLGPEDCRFIMIDPKMLELSVYNGIPHLLSPVITDPQKAVSALNWVVREMEERYKRMAEMSVRSIDVYNQRVRRAAERGEKLTRTVQTGYDPESGQPTFERVDLAGEPMPYIVVVVDEMADLMLTAGKEIEGAVQRLAQMARAAGIHLIMATQRPSVDVVTGTIKANFPTRISFKVASRIDSRTILGDQGAEQLLGAGDMLFASGSGNVVRVHGPFVADDEVEQIAGYLRTLGEPAYVDGIADDPAPADDHDELESEGSGDDLYDKAVAIVIRDRKASTSYLQRRLSIGYNRAADLMERMEADGIVSPANNVGKRDILILREGGDRA